MSEITKKALSNTIILIKLMWEANLEVLFDYLPYKS